MSAARTASPLVTAAIPTYNRAAYLREAIESALAQRYENVEVLVVDDGSTDETPAVAAAYEGRIRYLRQENGGRSAARNAAIRAARGAYVSFLDSDDRWLANKLELHVPVLEARPEVGMVHGHVNVVDAGGRQLPEETAAHRRIWSKANRPGVAYADLALELRAFSTAATFRRSAFDRVGLYDPELALDDFELYLRLALDYEVAFVEEPVADYRRHASNMDLDELTLGQIQGCLKHLRLLEGRPDVPDRERARRNLEVTLARSYATLGDRRESRRWAVRALRIDGLGIELVRRIVASFVPAAARASLRRRRPRPAPQASPPPSARS